MTLSFQILAAFLLLAATFFLWSGASDWAFAAFAVAVCSFFFGMRFRLKARVAERNAISESGDSE